MAFFRLPDEAENWFGHIKNSNPFKWKLDRYYLCMMLGLAAGRKETPSGTDIVDYFIPDYAPYERLIGGLLVRAELAKQGIDVDEKEDLRRIINELFDSSGPTELTDGAIHKLNMYAAGGFKVLTEARSRPQFPDEFLIDYLDRVQTEISRDAVWGESA